MTHQAQPPLQIETLGIRRDFDRDYDDVREKLPKALEEEGFGILTEIDVKETLKKKLGVDFRRYEILGACNPPAALRVLEAEPEIGLLLPCNVIIYELGPGKTRVSAFDPILMAAIPGKAVIEETAHDIRARLTRAIDSL
jgi:uncharacterized protein (DUF302 family)